MSCIQVAPQVRALALTEQRAKLDTTGMLARKEACWQASFFHCGIRFRRNVTLNKRRAAAIFRFLTPEISLTIIYPDYKSVQESSWVYIMHRALFQLVYSLIF